MKLMLTFIVEVDDDADPNEVKADLVSELEWQGSVVEASYTMRDPGRVMVGKGSLLVEERIPSAGKAVTGGPTN